MGKPTVGFKGPRMPGNLDEPTINRIADAVWLAYLERHANHPLRRPDGVVPTIHRIGKLIESPHWSIKQVVIVEGLIPYPANVWEFYVVILGDPDKAHLHHEAKGAQVLHRLRDEGYLDMVYHGL